MVEVSVQLSVVMLSVVILSVEAGVGILSSLNLSLKKLCHLEQDVLFSRETCAQ